MLKIIREMLADIRTGRHIDAYIAFLLSLGLAVIGIIGEIRIEILIAGVLLSMNWIIFNSLNNTKETEEIRNYLFKIRQQVKAEDFFYRKLR